jgi:hypothetical protein
LESTIFSSDWLQGMAGPFVPIQTTSESRTANHERVELEGVSGTAGPIRAINPILSLTRPDGTVARRAIQQLAELSNRYGGEPVVITQRATAFDHGLKGGIRALDPIEIRCRELKPSLGGGPERGRWPKPSSGTGGLGMTTEPAALVKHEVGQAPLSEATVIVVAVLVVV